MVWVLSLSTTHLLTHSLTPTLLLYGIRGLVGFGKLVSPLVHSVPYPRKETSEASPKAISG